MEILKVNNLSKVYGKGDTEIKALDSVSFGVEKGEFENSAVQTAMLSEPRGSATYGSQNTVRPYLYITAHDALSFQNRSIKLVAGRFP